MAKRSFRKRNLKIPIAAVMLFVFFASIFYFNFQINKNIEQQRNQAQETDTSQFPVIYQSINDKKINKMRAYRDINYSMVSNETLSVLSSDRKFDMIIEKNNSIFDSIEYEVRDKSSRELVERTVLNIPYVADNTIKVSATIQNLIQRDRTYTLTIKIDLIDKRAYYFTNIIYKDRTILENAIERVASFTTKTFNRSEAVEIIQFLETSPNRDLKQLHSVSIQSSFDQITWADTKMVLESEPVYKIYEAQNYCFNIDVNFYSTCERNNKKERYINVDQYVVRWDDKRFYIMKFDRKTEEILDLINRPYDEERDRFYLGVTNIKNIEKIESENKKYFMFTKQKEVFFYDTETEKLIEIYSQNVKDVTTYNRMSEDYNVKLMSVTDEGIARFLIYGYNMRGYNEGYLGISLFTYNKEEDSINEDFFIPIYTTYQNLKYDLQKVCSIVNNNFYFKTYDRVYSVNINTGEIVLLVQNLEETKCATSADGKFMAYNSIDDGNIMVINFENNTQEIIQKEEGMISDVIMCMNDDLFYGIMNEENIWVDDGKIIARLFDSIKTINLRTKETKVFSEKNIYYYNIITTNEIIKYNKYVKEGNHYKIVTNGVIRNNMLIENNEDFPIKEEYFNDKLRVAYINLKIKNRLELEKKTEMNLRQEEPFALEREVRLEKDIYYVYNNGTLVSKRNVLTDAISEIRDSFGYVKLNDSITCYNRSNKANVSYLRQEDSIMENIKGFKENFYLKENKVLVMNITGVMERDLEYYITLGQKVAVYKDNEFQFFVTGYDNNNYVLQYPAAENEESRRILTPRATVHRLVVEDGAVAFSQLEKLE